MKGKLALCLLRFEEHRQVPVLSLVVIMIAVVAIEVGFMIWLLLR